LYYRGKAITMAGPNEFECMESAITGESDDDDSIAGNVEEDLGWMNITDIIPTGGVTV
jgi:hypothetical protein